MHCTIDYYQEEFILHKNPSVEKTVYTQKAFKYFFLILIILESYIYSHHHNKDQVHRTIFLSLEKFLQSCEEF